MGEIKGNEETFKGIGEYEKMKKDIPDPHKDWVEITDMEDFDHLNKLIKYNTLLNHYKRYKIGFKEDSRMNYLIKALTDAIPYEDWDYCEVLCMKLNTQYDYIIKKAQLKQFADESDKTPVELKDPDLELKDDYVNSLKTMADEYKKYKENKTNNKDMVNHPAHYNVNGFEVIDIIKAFTDGLEGIQAVDTANAIKYILRWHHKNGVEDLKKAKWYIEHLIKEIEKV